MQKVPAKPFVDMKISIYPVLKAPDFNSTA